jgi:cytosine/adenosine deaminase-related metal-dependent hydrolase
MSHETILTNARLVLPTEVLDGTIVIRGDRIAEVQPAAAMRPPPGPRRRPPDPRHH